MNYQRLTRTEIQKDRKAERKGDPEEDSEDIQTTSNELPRSKKVGRDREGRQGHQGLYLLNSMIQ